MSSGRRSGALAGLFFRVAGPGLHASASAGRSPQTHERPALRSLGRNSYTIIHEQKIRSLVNRIVVGSSALGRHKRGYVSVGWYILGSLKYGVGVSGSLAVMPGLLLDFAASALLSRC